jgi:signal transduction histidine kinase/ligand-binding sensor domain-containing protein
MGRSVPWIGVLVALLGWGSVHASSIPLSVKDYVHTAWTQREGAPADVRAIVQTPDGWYWLGTSTGVYRFDGVTFEKQPIFPAQPDKSLSVGGFDLTSDGRLWVLMSYGGLVELQGKDYSDPHVWPGIPSDVPVDAVHNDASGHIWAIAGGEFYRLEGKQWRHLSKDSLGLPSAAIVYLNTDSAGTLWALTSDAVYRLLNGHPRFERSTAPFPQDRDAIWKANDGSYWKYTEAGEFRFNPADGPMQSEAGTTNFKFESLVSVIDRDGTLWFTNCGIAVLCRYPHAESVHGLVAKKIYFADKLTLDDNIMSGLSMTALIDQNGDLWVGTKAGIDRFRKPLANVVHFPDPLIYFSVIPNSDGSVWVGTASMGFTDKWWLVDGEHAPRAWSNFAGDTTASVREADGSILLGGASGLRRFDGKTMTPIDVPAEMKGRKIQTMLHDGAGRLWIAFRNAPVYQLDGTTWISKGHISALHDWHPITMAAGDHGSVWFGYSSSEVTVLRGKSLKYYTSQDGLQTGSVTAILPGNPLLVGGELGLAALVGDHFRMLQTNVPGTLLGITGIVLADDDCYWFNTQAGAVRIRASDVRHAVQNPDFKMPFQLVDTLSGMPGGAQRIRPLPSLTLGGDGRLWFAQMSGLAWIDPKEVSLTHAMLRVVIRGLMYGSQNVSADQPLSLPVGTRNFRIVYTALGASLPERVTFRYRLSGSGGDWQFAGSDRVANFGGLGPGNYQFELEASEDGASWTNPAVSLPIRIAPAFYQSVWFLVGCALLLVVLVVLATRRHIHVSNERLLARLQIRHAERERIARDLHDTLLQGVQGLILRVHAAAAVLPPEHPVAASIDQALELGDEILKEGRYRLRDLRLGVGVANKLSARIMESAQQYAADYPATFDIKSNGGSQAIEAVAGEEAFLITREALLNAFKHAQANHIQVDLDQGVKELVIRVSDDGRGMCTKAKDPAGAPNSWGLVGMRERAAAIGAVLVIKSVEGKGTDIILSIPAHVAYACKR